MRSVGRPRKPLDITVIRAMQEKGMNSHAIGNVLNCSGMTIWRRWPHGWNKPGRRKGVTNAIKDQKTTENGDLSLPSDGDPVAVPVRENHD